MACFTLVIQFRKNSPESATKEQRTTECHKGTEDHRVIFIDPGHNYIMYEESTVADASGAYFIQLLGIV